MKKLLVILLVLCLLLPGCTSGKSGISEEAAVAIVLEDLGVTAEQATCHIHSGVESNTPCFYIYATVGNQTTEYVIRMVDGKILSAEESSHSH